MLGFVEVMVDWILVVMCVGCRSLVVYEVVGD